MKDHDIHSIEYGFDQDEVNRDREWFRDMAANVPDLIAEIRRLRALLGDPLPEPPEFDDDDDGWNARVDYENTGIIKVQ
jgi:hypothetical protein